jgi:hypothetical protein
VLCLAAPLESDFLPQKHCASPILCMGHLVGMLLEQSKRGYVRETMHLNMGSPNIARDAKFL